MLPRFRPTEYETDDEGVRRLAGCVVLLDNAPIYVTNVINREIRYTPAERGGAARYELSIPLNDPRVNAMDLPLGYMNSTKLKEALYLRRTPRRDGYQGLRTVLSTEPRSFEARRVFDPSILTLAKDPGFAQMFANNYPSYDEAVDRMSRDPTLMGLAFSRRLAIDRDAPGMPMFISYRGKRIGWTDGTMPVRLGDESRYLVETLTEGKAKLA